MSAAFALILLAQAATSCPPGAPARLAGGAILVRPVGTLEPLPFEQLGPASGISRPEAVHQTGAASEAGKPDGEAPSDTCAVAAIPIV